jgi:glutamate/tyrosine decarboxylase-like PLP-dependent enzyme
VLAHGLRVDHPRFFGFVPLPGNPLCALAGALASGHAVFAGTWVASPGAAMVELVTLDWLRELLGLAPTTAGLFVSGGSMANLSALAVALHAAGPVDRSRLVAYASTQTHTSFERAARVLGVTVRRVATDDALRLDVHALRAAVADDRALPDAGARLPAGARRRAAAGGLRGERGLSARRGRGRRRGQLLRPRDCAHAPVRRAQAWLSLKVHRVDAFQRAIAHGIDLAEHAERVLATDPRWEVVTPAQLGSSPSGSRATRRSSTGTRAAS